MTEIITQEISITQDCQLHLFNIRFVGIISREATLSILFVHAPPFFKEIGEGGGGAKGKCSLLKQQILF